MQETIRGVRMSNEKLKAFTDLAQEVLPANMRGRKGTVFAALIHALASRSPGLLRDLGNAIIKYADSLEGK